MIPSIVPFYFLLTHEQSLLVGFQTLDNSFLICFNFALEASEK